VVESGGAAKAKLDGQALAPDCHGCAKPFGDKYTAYCYHIVAGWTRRPTLPIGTTQGYEQEYVVNMI
jgi:hypothetical protein